MRGGPGVARGIHPRASVEFSANVLNSLYHSGISIGVAAGVVKALREMRKPILKTGCPHTSDPAPPTVSVQAKQKHLPPQLHTRARMPATLPPVYNALTNPLPVYRHGSPDIDHEDWYIPRMRDCWPAPSATATQEHRIHRHPFFASFRTDIAKSSWPR
jgi:hypothetical protein